MNLFWYCDQCVETVNERLDIARRIDKLEQQTKEHAKTSADIIKKLDSANNGTKENNTWADTVKRNSFPPLIITPKDENQDSDATKKVVTQKINPENLSIAVKKIKSTSRGTVVIECNDGESLEKLQNTVVAELSDEYKIELPKTTSPKIMVIGIPEKHLDSDENFITKIKGQSKLMDGEETSIRVVKKYIPRNRKLYNVILEANPEVFKEIMKNGRIFIEWESFHVYEHVSVLRCYNCWKYGHKAANCRHEGIVCPLCSQDHKSNECKSTSQECTNCKFAAEVLKIPNVDFNHTVFDRNCVCYIKAQEKTKARTQYA